MMKVSQFHFGKFGDEMSELVASSAIAIGLLLVVYDSGNDTCSSNCCLVHAWLTAQDNDTEVKKKVLTMK